MTDRELKAIIDDLWKQFWSSGMSNPLLVMEQLTYLMFYKFFEQQEDLKDFKADYFNKERKTRFFDGREDLKWSNLKQLDPESMLKTYREKIFPILKEIHPIFNDAVCLISKASLLDTAVQTLDGIDFSDKGDVKGDLYEYMLSKLDSSGENGQFRTPRHIIEMMVKLIKPTAKDKICDPACGTGGFLCSAYHYILEHATSEECKEIHPRLGDMLSDADRTNIDNNVFFGYDFDPTMQRIGTMNLILHNIRPYNIKHLDSLSKKVEDKDKYSIILANPPFTGSLDEKDINPKLKAVVNTKKTELLFMANFIRMLEIGGRAAVIIPTGVLSTESNAYKAIREKLIENNQLEAVITMPSGVFKPYAGVSTAVLIFTKGGQTEKVWFYEMANDGKSLDDKRTTIEENDIPDVLEKYENKEDSEKSFNVLLKDLRKKEYNLLPSRYKKVKYKPIEFEHTPQEYINKMLDMEKKAISILEKLKEKVGGLV